MKRFYEYSLMLSIILIAGCGSSHKMTTISKGHYIDAPVEGVTYSCGSEHGVTDEEGTFFYELNKACKFSIGNYTFKTIKPEILSKRDVVIYENNVGIARMLQTLDLNGDASDGITVSSQEGKFLLKTDGLLDEDIAKLHKSLKESLNTYHGKYVTLDEAKAHIQSVQDGTDGLKAVINISSDSVRQNESITFDAEGSKGDIKSYKWEVAGKKVSDEESFTTSASDFNLGKNSVKLTITDSNGKSITISKLFTVLPKATVWDSAVTLHENSNAKLLVYDDDLNIYIKFVAKDMSGSGIEDVIYYIESDNDTHSGAGLIGFDYKLEKSGLFKLRDKDDYNGIKVQDINSTLENGEIVYTIKRSNIEYLAKDISIFPYGEDEPVFTDSKKYSFKTYTPMEDKVGPVISLDKKGLQTVALKGTLPQFTASAWDVGDKKEVTVNEDSSKVKLDKAGYYAIYFTAKDSKGNVSKKVVNIQVGNPNSSTLIEKKMGDLDESVIIQKGLVWANDDTTSNDSTRGCLIVGEDEDISKIKERFENYCKNSDYAGFRDWRTPTPLELSKYTIQMYDEGKTPGMARKHCIRTLSIENNSTVKAVNTHIIGAVDASKVHLIGKIYDSPLKPAGGRCVRGGVDNSIGNLKIIKKGNIELIEQKDKKLLWVSEFDPKGPACLAIHYDKPSEYEKSKNFCQSLVYAGFDDWRDPSSVEMKSFIVDTYNAHIIPGYKAPCKKLLARDDVNGTLLEKEVYTRFQKKRKLGEIADLNISKSNIGLRCVRDE